MASEILGLKYGMVIRSSMVNLRKRTSNNWLQGKWECLLNSELKGSGCWWTIWEERG